VSFSPTNKANMLIFVLR